MYPSDIRSLTSLRIAAALWVLVYHFRDHLGLELSRFGLIAKGYLGVDLFFILSGFILSHVYAKAWAEGRFNYGSFLWARLARIYPVHLVTLAATVAIWLVARQIGANFDPVAFDLAAIPKQLLLVHAWGVAPTVQWNFPSWSISAEWFAYLLFPAVAILSGVFRRFAGLGVALAAALFVGLYLATEALGVQFTQMTAQIGAVRIIPAFLMGAALHRLGSTVNLPSKLAFIGAGVAVVWVAVSASLQASDLIIWPALALLIFCLAESAKTAPQSWLAAAPLVYLGEVSYGVYMTHLPVDIAYFKVMERVLPEPGDLAPLVWAGVFAVCLAASVVCFHLVEQPARTWLRARDPFARRPVREPREEPVI